MGSTTTPTLAQVQQFMQAALLGPGAVGATPHDLLQQTHAHIASSARLSPAQHLAIYHRGYYARLLQCLQGQYKALCHALGTELFNDFAREYLREHPSRSPTLAVLGENFPAWLHRNRPDAQAQEKEGWIDLMADLADFEWTLYSLFDAPGAEETRYAQAEALQRPNRRLQPCVRLRHYRYPVSGYYQQVASGQEPELPGEQECWIALVRTNYRTGIFSLRPAQHFLLKLLQDDGDRLSIQEGLEQTARAFGMDLVEMEKGWAAWVVAWEAAGFFLGQGLSACTDSHRLLSEG